MSLTPQTQLRCYPKAEISRGADRIRARPAVGATPRRVRPGHDAQGCWARHDPLTNATLAAEFGTQNCYLAMAAMRPDPPKGCYCRRAGTCHDATGVKRHDQLA